MDSYNLGQIIGPELLNREYKELCLSDIHLFFDKNDLVILFYSEIKTLNLNSIKFNDMIYFTLNNYVQKYIPKYIGNFSKANIAGDLFFGINDNGFIEGIPFFGVIDIGIINKMFNSAIYNSRGVYINDDNSIKYDKSVVDLYYTNIKVSITNINIPDSNSIEFNKIKLQQINKLNKLKKKNQQLKDSWDIFHNLYIKWQIKLTKYAGKLVNYLTNEDMRIEVINYIINDFKLNISYDQSKLESIISFFSQDLSFYIDLSFSVDSIEEIIKSPYSPIKWLIKYKDHILSKIKKIKPIAPTSKPDPNLYLKYCNNISNISSFLITSDPDIKFYLIKISIPKIESTYLEYRYNQFLSWQSKERINSYYGPSCI
jgi:hypothetical protein